MQNLKLLIATYNPGKFKEYKLIFKKLLPKLKVISLKELGIKKRIEENGKTFEENAIKKAKFYCKLTNLPTLADDSGLEIDYFNGEPGVKSRYWPGYRATDKELINFALEKLKGVPLEKRKAQLRAIIAVAFPDQNRIYTFEGKLKGFIAEKPIKKIMNGYPFRSIFIPSGTKKYLGELSIIAHRKKAVKKALPIIKKYLVFHDRH